MPIADLATLINASSQNLSQFKGLSVAYNLLGGTPSIDGYTALIGENNTSNFGAGGTTVFNDENVYINVLNALYQGNAGAKTAFDAIVSGQASLQDQLKAVYESVIPAGAQTAAGLAFFQSQSAFYTARAAELNIAGSNGAALVGYAALAKIAVDGDISGLGDSINDLIAATNDGSAAIPQDGSAFTPLETADGTNFDADDSSSAAGQVLTFIPAVADNLMGTAGDDTFRAVDANSLVTSDQADGGAGTDTLNISDLAYGPGSNAPVLKNIEIINNSSDDAFDLSASTGVEQMWSMNAGGGTYTGAMASTTFGSTAGGAVNIDYTTPSTANLAVKDNDAVATNFISVDAAKITAVNLASNGDAGKVSDVVSIAGIDDGATSFTLTGSGDATVTSDGVKLTSVDGSAATGTTSFTSGVLTADFTAMGGSGVNTLDFTAATTGKGTITGGAGNDTLLGGAAADMIDGGTGADMMTGNAGADTFTIDSLSPLSSIGLDQILDFVTKTDKIEFGGDAGSATNYVELGAAAADFGDAKNAADSSMNGTVQYVAVGDGVNTYVFYDADKDGTADDAVQLTGGANVAFVEMGDIA